MQITTFNITLVIGITLYFSVAYIAFNTLLG